MTDKEDKTVRQFVLFCRTALMYEKKNYYNERKHRVERETHIEMLTLRQSGMLEKIFDTYHADYFSVMGYDIGIIDGDLAQALRELSDRYLQIVLMTSFPKLLNALGGIYSGERNEYLQSLNRYQLLIIDDLGVERDTPYVLETVYLVIDERYKSGNPFIITTNLSLQELQNPADLEHGRIYDRIMERCVPVAFSGRNYRTDKGRANMKSASGILRE